MTENEKKLKIRPIVKNNDDSKQSIYLNESALGDLFKNETSVKPKLALVLDSTGGLTPIALSKLETTALSSIDDLNDHLRRKFSDQNATTMPPFKFNDSLSITGLGKNSCVWIFCNGDLILICD